MIMDLSINGTDRYTVLNIYTDMVYLQIFITVKSDGTL